MSIKLSDWFDVWSAISARIFYKMDVLFGFLHRQENVFDRFWYDVGHVASDIGVHKLYSLFTSCIHYSRCIHYSQVVFIASLFLNYHQPLRGYIWNESKQMEKKRFYELGFELRKRRRKKVDEKRFENHLSEASLKAVKEKLRKEYKLWIATPAVHRMNLCLSTALGIWLQAQPEAADRGYRALSGRIRGNSSAGWWVCGVRVQRGLPS